MDPLVLEPLGGDGKIFIAVSYEKRITAADDAAHASDHIHDFYELYVNLSGDISFSVKDTLYPVKSGDVMITSPHEHHRCICHSDGIHEYFLIGIKDFSFAEKMPSLREKRIISLPPDEKKRLISLCFSLTDDLQRNETNSFAALHSFYGILSLIFSSGRQAPDSSGLPKYFSDIVDYITRHCSEPSCTAASLCERFYISQSTLLRRFNKYLQTTPSKFIEAKRFSEAEKLLCAGMSVQDACFASGFTDCSYFILRFRQKFGITPLQYQKNRHILRSIEIKP